MSFLLGLSSKVYLIALSALLGITLVLGISNYIKIGKIEDLQRDVLIANAEFQQERSNNKVLSAEIGKQNAKIEAQRVEYDDRVAEFEAWKKIPIYKVVLKEIKSDECEDIKSMLDTIRNTGF